MSDFVYLKDMSVDSPVFARPEPTEEDYANGYIIRYICRQSNNINASVIEINKKQFDALTHPLYIKTEMYWFIKGNKQEVQDKNMKAMIGAEFIVRGTKNYVMNNLLKYWKE